MRICVINTGGTISCAGQPLAPMPSERFAAAVTRLLDGALAAALPGDRLHFDTGLRFTDQGPGLLDSTDLRPSDWCRIAARVLELYDSHDAFVILHGTDTMDYSGAALPLLLNVFDDLGFPRVALSKPVILTGSQLPLLRDTPAGPVLNTPTDALNNLASALQAARLGLPEVAVFFDGKLLRGCRTVKMSTTRLAAFGSPHLPPLAEIGLGIRHGTVPPLPGPAAPAHALGNPAARAQALAQLAAVSNGIDRQRIAQITAVPADHGARSPLLAQMVDDALRGGATGLLLKGFGEGNMPAGNGALQAALARADVPVVIASTVPDGQVGAFHYAAGAWIAATGAMAAGDTTPVAALAKLMILNAAARHHGWDRAAIAALMARSLVGECGANDRMEGPLLPCQRLTAADGPVVLENDPDLGPRLIAEDRVLWQAPSRGRLQMRGDRLVLVAPDGAIRWTSPPAVPGAVPVLTAAPRALRLVDPAMRHAPITALEG